MSQTGGPGTGPGPSGLLRVLARVECRSESAGEKRPVAVWIGGRRAEIERIVADAVIGPAEAGLSVCREVDVETVDGRRLRVVRELPHGEWKVFLLR